MADDAPGRELLRIEAVSVAVGAASIDDRLKAGEIVGLAGLEGHGQEAFLETLAGLRPPVSGRILIDDKRGRGFVPVTRFRTAVQHGIAYLARDRRANGVFPGLSVLDNFSLASMPSDTHFGFINPAARRRRYDAWQQRLGIVANDPKVSITALSGGNQQKVLLARWLARGPRVLLLNDPTRGVDHRTREVLYAVFRELARDEGLTLVMVSTEIEETLRLCDRVLVFRDQQVQATLSDAGLSSDRVIAAMFGRAS